MFNFIIILILITHIYCKSEGVYRYVNKDSGKTHYVGTTNDFDRRHKEHVHDKHYYSDTTKYDIKKTYMNGESTNKRYIEEVKQIKYYNPIANKHPGGNGRRH